MTDVTANAIEEMPNRIPATPLQSNAIMIVAQDKIINNTLDIFIELQ